MFDRKDKSYDKDSLRTPRWLFEWLNEKYLFDVDLAASRSNALCRDYITEKEDSTLLNWFEFGDSGFCNPPYSKGKIESLIEPAITYAKDNFTSVFVIPELNGEARTKDIMLHAAKIIHFDRRVNFWHPTKDIECKGNNRGTICVEFSKKPFDVPAQHIFCTLSEVKERGLEIYCK